MPVVGFETTATPFQRSKTIRALDSSATVIGSVRARETMKGNPPELSNTGTVS
jgi:hypothetical protein